MALPRGLAETILKYRKRKRRPLSPTIPSYAGQYDTAKPVTRVPGDTERTHNTKTPIPTSYMDGTREDYFPHPGFMEIPRSDYETFDRDLVKDISGMGSQEIDALRHIAPAPRGFDHTEHVKYEDCLMEKDFFSQQMRLLAGQFEEGEVIPFEHSDIIDEILADREPKAELRDDIDFIQQRIDMDQLWSQEFFEQQIQVMEAQFSQPEYTQFDHKTQMEMMFNVQKAMFDAFQTEGVAMEQATVGQTIEEMMLPPDQGGQSLEQIVQTNEVQDSTMMQNDIAEMPGYGDCLMNQEVFEQQMHEAVEGMAPEQANPYDSEMMQEQMYDEPMPQDMMDPAMMDPYMMPGAMAPEYMPDQGPGPMM